MLNRYTIITSAGFKREMVLLQGFPCKWGRCLFCDYIHDNSSLEDQMNEINFEVLEKVTGETGKLDVINSGSIFELPEKTMIEVRRVVKDKGIKELFVEAHWLYKERFAEFRKSFDIPVRIRVGVESFDDNFRNNVLKKGMSYKSIDELKEYCDSICLMVGIKGQTKEMIAHDIETLTKNFKYGAISIFTNNTTDVKVDEDLVLWFRDTYGNLDDYPYIDVLYNNLDYGVNA